jgi:hypothetical protein
MDPLCVLPNLTVDGYLNLFALPESMAPQQRSMRVSPKM